MLVDPVVHVDGGSHKEAAVVGVVDVAVIAVVDVDVSAVAVPGHADVVAEGLTSPRPVGVVGFEVSHTAAAVVVTVLDTAAVVGVLVSHADV